MQIRRVEHCFSSEGTQLLRELLKKNPAERLTDPVKIREHVVFREVLFQEEPVDSGWEKVLHKQVSSC